MLVEPTLWFHMLEIKFELADPKAVTESKTKYYFSFKKYFFSSVLYNLMKINLMFEFTIKGYI